MTYITDAAKEYAKKHAKDDEDIKARINEILRYLNDELRSGTYQFKPSDVSIICYDYSSIFATFHITVHNITIYYDNGNEKSNTVSFGFYIRFDEKSTVPNIHAHSFKAYLDSDHINHLHNFNTTTLSKVFHQIDAYIISKSNQTQSQIQEKDIVAAAEMLFALVSAMNNYLDESYKLAKKCENFMNNHNIIGGPGDFDFNSARFDFDDDILSIKSNDDAINYIKDRLQ